MGTNMPLANSTSLHFCDKQKKFPTHFVWGTATSAYQIEGASQADGKLDSIWDVFCRKPGAIANNENGEIACDHYQRWKEDLQLMQEIGIKAYRFSISWTRIIPEGDGDVNERGLAFYNQVIDTLLQYQIEPVITLYHWDLPQKLQENGGWVSRKTAEAFENYALTCFIRFKDRVKIWITLNEPWVISFLGYRKGIHAPGICNVDDSIKAAHYLLLSHGMALKAMREFDPAFKGKIGIALNLSPVFPVNNLEEKDRIAANQRDLFLNRFFMDALFKEKYPEEVFTLYPILNEIIQPGDMQTIASPLNFLGINYYTRTLVKGIDVNGLLDEEVLEILNPYSNMWEFYPEGFKTIIEWVWNTYHPPEIMITENGTALDDWVTSSGEVNDDNRIHYIREHLKVLYCLIERKIPITGYFVWSFLDNFEWSYGYSKRFGLVYIDFLTLNRIPKKSAKWFGDVCKNCSIFT